jgi:hypothetical protein
MLEENEELRHRLGITDKTPIDLSNIRHLRSVELEQTKSLNSTLQTEIEKLEVERLDLKAKMRVYSLERGTRAVELGLTADDLVAVEQYAAKLRYGTEDESANHHPATFKKPTLQGKELEKLVLELERTHLEASDARDQVKAQDAEIQTLKETMRQLENVIKEISGSMTSSATGAGPSTDVMAKFVKMLEKKGSIIDVSKRHTELNKDVENNVMTINTALRSQLQDERARFDKLNHSHLSLLASFEKTKLERDTWKKTSETPSRRLLTLPPELALATVSGYSSLVDQLVECLMDLKVKEREIRLSRDALLKYKESYATLAGNLQRIYIENQSLKSERDEAKATAKRVVDKAEDEKTRATTRLREFEKMVSTEYDSQDQVKRALTEAQRNLVVLKVNEETLTRRYVAAVDGENSLHKENHKLKVISLASVAVKLKLTLYVDGLAKP